LLFEKQFIFFCLFVASEELYKEKSAEKQLKMETLSNEMKEERKAKQTALTWRLKRDRYGKNRRNNKGRKCKKRRK